MTGSAAIGSDMLFAAEESIRNTEWTTIILVLLILLAVYRAPGLVFVPLVTIGVSVVVAMGLVASATQLCTDIGIDFKIFKTTRIFVIVILFGAGTDYCLFLIARYKENCNAGCPPNWPSRRRWAKVGDALVASALTTILGNRHDGLLFLGKFRNSGPSIALCLVVALAASMTLAPALLRATGKAVFWPWGIGKRARDLASEDREGTRGGWSLAARFWRLVGRQILARPGWIFCRKSFAAVARGCSGTPNRTDLRLVERIAAESPSVRGTNLLRRFFPGGEIGPVTVLAFDPRGGLDTDDGLWQRIQPLAERMKEFRPSDGLG